MKYTLPFLLLAMAACGGGDSATNSPSGSPTETAMESVARTCGLSLHDDGTTLVVKFQYSDSPKLVCVVDGLQIPTYVMKQLGNATDLSGPITATWDTYTATNRTAAPIQRERSPSTRPHDPTSVLGRRGTRTPRPGQIRGQIHPCMSAVRPSPLRTTPQVAAHLGT
jgi:hypothetical protein